MISRRQAVVCIAVLALTATGLTIALTEVRPAVAAEASQLGDLSEFRTIVEDTLALVAKPDLNAATIRIKDLETSWDDAEAGLKPRAASDWHKLDKAIDKALDALRADSPVADDCKAALTEILAIMDNFAGKS